MTDHDILLALLVISNLAFLFTLILLYQQVEEEFSSTIGKRTIIFLSVFPTAFFFFAPYPQSLSLFLVLAAYMAARRSKWFLATIAGILAGLPHSTVLPLILVLGYESYLHMKQCKNTNKWLILLPPIGPALGTILFFAWRISIGLPPISEILKEYWGRIIQFPWQTLSDTWNMIKANSLPVTSWINLIMLLVILLIILTLHFTNFIEPIEG